MIDITKSDTISCSFSITSTIPSKDISSAVGYNVSGSETISIKGSYKVPTKFNGKKVKKGHLDARAIYQVKKFDIERRKIINGVAGGAWQKTGTGSAKKPIGVDFSKRHTYK